MDIHVKDLMTCVDLDLSEDQSVLYGLFGFRRSLVPPDPTGATAQVKLRELAEGIDGDHIHLNVIRVGFDFYGENELDRVISIDYSILRIRDIFRPQGVGVGRVQHYSIASADSDGMANIDDDAEAKDLWRSFSVDNDGIDAFVVRSIDDFLGLSPVPGSCTLNHRSDGLLAGGVDDDAEGMSRTFAHEVGHFLGLDHNHGDDPDCPGTAAGKDNLMAQTRCATSTRGSVKLTNSQGNTMDDHCSIQGACS